MKQKARLSHPNSLFSLETRSFPPMPILEKGSERYIQAISFIKRCFGKKWQFCLDNKAQTIQEYDSRCFNFTLYPFSSYSCSQFIFSVYQLQFCAEMKCDWSRKNKVQPGLSGSSFKPALARRPLSRRSTLAIESMCLGSNFLKSGLGQGFRVDEPQQAQSKRITPP